MNGNRSRFFQRFLWMGIGFLLGDGIRLLRGEGNDSSLVIAAIACLALGAIGYAKDERRKRNPEA